MNVKDRYQDAAGHALAGFQLIEEHLKEYIGHYYDTVRVLMAGKLSFQHKREDIEDAPLERLTNTFARINANAELVKQIRSLIRVRNEVAHRAFKHLYGPSKQDADFEKSIKHFIEVAQQLSAIMKDLLHEELLVLQVAKDYQNANVPE